MRRLDAGTAGTWPPKDVEAPSARLSREWQTSIRALTAGRPLRPVQRVAFEEARILESRQHLVLCAPTNSGKSVVGYALLLEAVRRGQRAVLLEPLRALAQEQSEALEVALARWAEEEGTPAPRVHLSTGDYRLQGELLSDPPPQEGEILVATPERLEALLREPTNAAWLATVGAVVVDEAHLLGDRRRGPTLELLVASLLSTQAPPRIALLSATVGAPERLERWLRPCQLITVPERTPPLHKEVWALEEGDDADAVLFAELRTVLADPAASVLVFVYRRGTAEAQARRASEVLGVPVWAYHSGQSRAERARIRADFEAGTCRCLVTTTALAMGVNLPATHVYVRDTHFHGVGRLGVTELLQILGRAGRGAREGHGAVLLRSSDPWGAGELVEALRAEALPPLCSSLEQPERRGAGATERLEVAATLVSACLARGGEEGLSVQALQGLLENTFGGRSVSVAVNPALRWLADTGRVLAFPDETQRYRLTVLGRTGARAVLPLRYVAGWGQLVRDLLSLDASARLLGRWSPVDHLFTLALLSDRTPSLRRFSQELVEQVDSWLESRPENRSFLFAEWVVGSASGSKADELLGSLGLAGGPSTRTRADARQRSYGAMLSALILEERARGTPLAELERRWRLSGLEGLEESWRDTALWLLAGQAALCEVRCFYHHLREGCAASPDQVRDAKRALRQMRSQAYDLMERLKYCSPLGPLLRGVRNALRAAQEPLVGPATVRKLEEAGVTTLQQVAQMDVDALVALGVQKRFAKQIRSYLRMRMR